MEKRTKRNNRKLTGPNGNTMELNEINWKKAWNDYGIKKNGYTMK